MKRVLFALLVLMLGACQSNEIAESKDVNPETIFQQYEVRYAEGDPTVQCTATFRFGGANGTTLVLSEKSSVALDGHQIGVDSSKMRGAYYDMQQPAATFSGKHSFVFTDVHGKTFINPFRFSVVEIDAAAFAENIAAGDLVIPLKNATDGDKLTVNLHDTASGSNGFDSVLTVVRNQLIISKTYINKLADGPLTLYITKEQQIPLAQTTREGGSFSITCTLKQRRLNLQRNKNN